MQPAVYILASKKNGVIFVGVANHLPLRMIQHKTNFILGFTHRYKINRLVYYKLFKTSEEAIAWQKPMRTWQREWTIDLIEQNNKEWEDLYLEMDDL